MSFIMICIHLIFSHRYLAKISPIWRKTLSNQSVSQSYFFCCEILSSMKVIMIPSVNPNYQYMYHFVFNKETISIYIYIHLSSNWPMWKWAGEGRGLFHLILKININSLISRLECRPQILSSPS